MKENKAIILSGDADAYGKILLGKNLQGLSIEACRDVDQAVPHLKDTDIIFGTPVLICPLLSRAPRLKWVQFMWAGITPFLAPGMRQDYFLTGVKEVFGPMMAEYVICHMLMHERRSFDALRRNWKGNGVPGHREHLWENVWGSWGLAPLGRPLPGLQNSLAWKPGDFPGHKPNVRRLIAVIYPRN